MAERINKLVGDRDERVSIFSAKFRTPRLPLLEELKVLKVWEKVLELMDFEAELLDTHGMLLFDLVSQKRVEKEGANPDFVESLRKEVSLRAASSSGSKHLPHLPGPARSKSGLQSKPEHHSGEVETKDKAEFKRGYRSSTLDGHPDELVARFLVQQDWHVGKAFGQLVTTMRWKYRKEQADKIVLSGEEGALITIEDESADKHDVEVARGFLTQCQQGKTVVRGIDWEGRPIVHTRMKLHRPHMQPPESMRQYVMWQIDSAARLMLGPSILDVVQLWDFTDAKSENVELGPVKFMVDLFQKYYPGAIGILIMHKAPKWFEKSWRIIKGWLSPAAVAKVKFTRTVEELEQYIPRQNIVKDLGGDDPWEFEYIPVQRGENDHMRDVKRASSMTAEHRQLWDEFDSLTRAMAKMAQSGEDYTSIKRQRNDLTNHLRVAYWKLDPYIRARTYYDRIGALGFRRESAFLAVKLTYEEHVESLLGSLDSLSTGGPKAPTSSVYQSDYDYKNGKE